MANDSPPPPPPLPTCSTDQPPAPTRTAPPNPPTVPPTGPAGAFLVELMVFSGHPFKDHWAYWVCSHSSPDLGVLIHAVGDVRNGFEFQVKRGYDFRTTQSSPSKRVGLQWVDGKWFDEKGMFNEGRYVVDSRPVCGFEESLYKVKAPGKSLNVAGDNPSGKKPVTQKNCQTWIVEAADQLVRDHIFDQEVADYLNAIKQ